MQLDPVTFLLEIVNFFVLLWILKRFLYAPVQAAVAQRQQKLDQVLQDAQAKETRAEALRVEQEGQAKRWQEERAVREAQLQSELAAERARQLEKIRAAAADEQTRLAAQRSEEEKVRMKELAGAARRESLQFAGHLLERLATPALDAAFVEVLLEDLAAQSPDALAGVQRAAREAGGKVIVASAHALPDEARLRLSARMQEILGLPLECRYAVRSELKGGLRVEVGALVLHANLNDELVFFEQYAGHESR